MLKDYEIKHRIHLKIYWSDILKNYYDGNPHPNLEEADIPDIKDLLIRLDEDLKNIDSQKIEELKNQLYYESL